MILPWAGLVTLVINAFLSWYKQDTPYFPIDMSKIANNYPQYYIFVGGMCITAYGIGKLSCPLMPELPKAIAICLILLAFIQDQYDWVFHVFFSTSFFLLSCLFLVAQGMFSVYPWSTMVLIGFVALEKLLGLMLILLYGRLQENEPDYVVHMRQFKGLAQWLSIVGLMVMVSRV
jgi:hypothetical protein